MTLRLASALFFALSSAQGILEQLSFGQRTPISTDHVTVPNWSLSGLQHQVRILSDRLVVTPPVPGNTRGAIWAETPVSSDEWSAEFQFRASGQDGGTGNLQLWYSKDKAAIGTNSAYTVEQFDGLVLVIDQYGGTGGKIRGFLNDGSQNYRTHPNPESLAFGHCDYAYRNLGRFSKLEISHSNGLTVSIDGRECFRSDQISLPSGYYFGISAATGDNPDSFEANKFIVRSGSSGSSQNEPAATPRKEARQGAQTPPAVASESSAGSTTGLTSQQYNDLQKQLRDLDQKLTTEFQNLNSKLDRTLDQTVTGMLKSSVDDIRDLGRRIDNIERMVSTIQRDIGGRDYRQQLSDLQHSLEKVKGGITEHLPNTLGQLITSSTPRWWTLFLVVVAVQIMMAGVYFVYKRRRDGMPKKFL